MKVRSFLQTPRIEINIKKLKHNARFLKERLAHNKCELMVVTKAFGSDKRMIQALIEVGIQCFGESNLQHIKSIKEQHPESCCALIRAPSLAELIETLKYCDYSFNSELETIFKLNEFAQKLDVIHDVILMVENGDMREGFLYDEVVSIIPKILALSHIRILGIGANYACFTHRSPSDEVVKKIDVLALHIETVFNIKLKIISTGNSSTLPLFLNEKQEDLQQIRVGESLLTGRDPISDKKIEGLMQNVLTFKVEIIESKFKNEENQNRTHRALLNFGYQDAPKEHIVLDSTFNFVNQSSNHTVMLIQDQTSKLGCEINLELRYRSMVQAFMSPNVYKRIVEENG